MSPILILVLLAVIICVSIVFRFIGGSDQAEPEPYATSEVEPITGSEPESQTEQEAADLPAAPTSPFDVVTPQTAKPAAPTSVPLSSGSSASTGETAGGDTWTILLYQDADDKILEQDIYVDLNEAEKAGSGDGVNVIAQIDRYKAGYTGDGNWTSTRRYFISYDAELSQVRSELIDDLGEVNMADGQTLVDFVTWAVEKYPADKYALILSDHGMGWPGGWSDPTSTSRGPSNLPLAQVTGDQLFLMELDEALTQIRSETGIEKFELIGMDACLMSHIEVYTALAPHAYYAVASQETEPSLGWAYTSFLTGLRENPGITGGQLGELIVNGYIKDDQRIVDNQARAEMYGGNSLMNSLFGASSAPSAAQVAQQLSQTITLTAVDLGGLPELQQSLNNFAYTLQSADQRAVAQARSYAQSFTSIFGSDVPGSYLDLGSLAQIVADRSNNSEVANASQSILDALNKFVVAEKHGAKKPGATGVSIYFPNSELYQSSAAGPASYTVAAQRFAQESLWDDFLAYHYTRRSFEPASNQVAVPQRSETIEAPATGGIEVSPLSLTDDTASIGSPVTMSADISGDNIGYIKLLVGYLDQAANSINYIDTDYLESGETLQANGVYYPDWGEGAFRLEFDWEPIVYGISDGQNVYTALLSPVEFGASREEAIYSVDGIYTYTSGEQRYARLYFQNGNMTQVFGFTGTDGPNGAPREITPSPGDTFTILDQWMDLDSQGNVVDNVYQEGGTLTFNEALFTWQELEAPAGMYVIGYIVEDLDGKAVTVFDQVTVR